MATAITHYVDSEGKEHVIKTMPTGYLNNALNTKMKAFQDGETANMVGALQAEVNRRIALQAGVEAETRPKAAPVRTHVLAPADDNGPPPEDELAPFRAQMEKDAAGLVDEIAGLLIKAARLPKEPDSDDDVAKINKWVVDAGKLRKKAEAARVEAKEPFLKRGKVIDTWFGQLGANLKTRAETIEQRSAPYLLAKKQREEAEAKRIADESRKAAEEYARVQKASADAARKASEEAAAAAQKLADAKTQEEADTAEAELRKAHRTLNVEEAAADQAGKDAKKLDKVADRAERSLAGDHTLERTQGGGGAARLNTAWFGRIDKAERLIQSLGPLGSYFTEGDMVAALARAAKQDPRPEVPGVVWESRNEVKTSATRS